MLISPLMDNLIKKCQSQLSTVYHFLPSIYWAWQFWRCNINNVRVYAHAASVTIPWLATRGPHVWVPAVLLTERPNFGGWAAGKQTTQQHQPSCCWYDIATTCNQSIATMPCFHHTETGHPHTKGFRGTPLTHWGQDKMATISQTTFSLVN